MKRKNYICQLRHGMSITARFGFCFTLLLMLIAIVAATGYLSLRFIRDTEKSVYISMEIQRLVLKMNMGIEKARRLHRDFFLQYPEIGLTEAHKHYVQPSIRQIAHVVADSKTLKNMVAESIVSNALKKSHVDLNLYLSSARRFADTSILSVELVTELAAPERGLEALLDKHFALLQAEIVKDDELKHLYFEMKSFAQDYRITRKRFLMQSAFNVVFTLRKKIGNSSLLTRDQKDRGFILLDQITGIAEKILNVDVAIKSKFNDFVLQEEAIAPISNTLIKLAREEVSQAQKRIAATHRLATIIIAFITIAGLIAAVNIARILNRSITRRIVRLTKTAAEFRKGNLNVIAVDEGRDELGELATTFNSMAVRIKDSINNLEEKVKRRTARLTESEKRFRQLFEHSSSGVAVYESVGDGDDFIFKDVNHAVEIIEGVKREELIERKVTEVFPGVIESGLFDVFRKVWQTGQSAHHPVKSYSDDRLSGWRENSVYKLPSGEIVALCDDLTIQKQAEFEKQTMEARLQRARKMEAIGLLAGGIAHDLNNILAGIIGYPELLLMQISEDSELRESIKAIHNAGQRATAVVADLLTVARGVAIAKTIVNLNSIIEEYKNSPEHQRLQLMHENVNCVTELDPNVHSIACSPIHIKKCLMNLLINAMEAIADKGHVKISTYNQNVDEVRAKEKGIKAGEYVILRVTDSGGGISANDLEHIFEPFYTKKVMGRSGTGFGLAIVWNSVQEHGGTVLVKSSEQGTSFELYFPASKQEITSEQKKTGIAELMGNGEKILVVDDEKQLRDLAGRMLNVLGYNVKCVSSGEKAIDYLKQNNVDLILLDMLMEPGINGRETYENIIKIHPGQKAVIASGFSESDDIRKTQQLGVREFIGKPYSMEQLGKVVKKAMSNNQTALVD